MSTLSNYYRSLDWVYEKDCVVCSRWPKAERARRRGEGGDYITLPLKEPVCARCWAAFWEGIGACQAPTKH
jgi:hypothetical protein